MNRRAVVTGMGVVSSLGLTPEQVFDAVLAGADAGREVERWQGEGLRVTRAAIVDREPVFAALGGELEAASAVGPTRLPWGSSMALLAARRALHHAGLGESLGTIPLVASCTIGAPGAAEPADKNWSAMDPTTSLACYGQGALVAYVAAALGARGAVECVMSTCAGGNYAIGNALDQVRSGRAAVVLAGGLEEVSTMVFTAFHQLRAVADHCTPFDINRKGLLFGEGAAFVVVEDEEHAHARGAHIHAYVLGIGYANDAHHLVQPDQDGASAAMAIRRALDDAGVLADAVGYVNAHGTGTEANDAAELSALRAVFGRDTLPVSSTKGATGHLMGAASALEAVLTTLAYTRRTLPHTAGLRDPIADAGVTLLREPTPATVDVAVSTGFGFGGNDAALVLGAAHDTAVREARSVYINGGSALVGGALGLDSVWRRFVASTALEDRRVTFEPEAILGKKGLRHVDRGALLWAAALEHDLPEWPEVAKDRAGAVFGAAYPAYQQVVGIMRDYQSGGAKNVNPMRVPHATANCAPSWWLIRRGVTGFSSTVGSGECAGIDAVIAATTQIALGRVDTLIAGGAEGEVDELWRGLTRIAWHQQPFAEAAAALVLTYERADAFAHVVDHESAFDREHPERAVERAVEILLTRQRTPLVDVAVSPRPLALDTYANHQYVTGEIFGEALGASSALAAVIGAQLLRPPYRAAAQVLVVSDSMDGYASAMLLEAVEPLAA